MTDLGRYCPSTHCCYHQGTAPHIDLNFDGATLLGQTQFKEESLTEVLRHPSCEQVHARRVLSCHHLQTMEAKVNPIRSGRGRHCEVHSDHEPSLFMFSSGKMWFSSEVLTTTIKNSVTCSAN